MSRSELNSESATWVVIVANAEVAEADGERKAEDIEKQCGCNSARCFKVITTHHAKDVGRRMTATTAEKLQTDQSKFKVAEIPSSPHIGRFCKSSRSEVMALPKSPISSLLLMSACGLAKGRLSEYVDPLIGTEGSTPGSAIAGGNSFPGASLPNAVAKVGIDTSYLGVPNGTAVDCNAGYSPLGNVTAISMLHVSGSSTRSCKLTSPLLSGTGGVPTYGLISQMPLLGGLDSVNFADNTTYWQNRSMGEESAQVGLFQTTLLNGIEIDITSTAHTGLLRYRFPAETDVAPRNNLSTPAVQSEASDDGHGDDAHVLVDLTHTDTFHRYYLDTVHMRTPKSSSTGTCISTLPESQTLYFCGNFTSPNGNLQPSSDYVVQNTMESVQGAGTFSWPYNPLLPPTYDERPVPRSYNDVLSYAGSGMGIGALFSWKPTSANMSAERVIEARLGVSYISAGQACASLAAEAPENRSFEDVVEDVKVDWEENVLGTIQVEDNGSQTNGNATLKRMLYTALYQTELSANLHAPTNKTGENPKWQTNASNPYYDDHYTLWDTYRTLMPLYHLLYTKTYADVLSGLISIFTNEGFLPAGRIANWNGRAVLTRTWCSATHLQRTSKPTKPFSTTLRTCPPVTKTQSPSMAPRKKDAEQYAQNDYAIYSMAKGLNGSESSTFRDRAGWWENQWNPYANTSLEGVGSFTGFPGARNQDAISMRPRFGRLLSLPLLMIWRRLFSSWEVMNSSSRDLMQAFYQGLGQALERTTMQVQLFSIPVSSYFPANSADALLSPGKEMSPYHNSPNFSASALNSAQADENDQNKSYGRCVLRSRPGRIPGFGQSFTKDLYPVSAQPIYLLSAPRFEALSIRLFGGTAQETRLNISAPGISDSNYYPQTVTFNGQKLNRSWMTHYELGGGGELVRETTFSYCVGIECFKISDA
ncbi:hypothetical protein KC337_g11 [Hortaea werneckii]|nr:hypothetical protein KC337_g11 [Hortaea werneckii]